MSDSDDDHDDLDDNDNHDHDNHDHDNHDVGYGHSYSQDYLKIIPTKPYIHMKRVILMIIITRP